MQMEQLLKLNYPDQNVRNGYYSAHVAPGIGVTVAQMVTTTFVQFFPWNDSCTDGHGRYAAFITAKATQADAVKAELFIKWPYLESKELDDLLIIKCLIEDGLKQIGERNADDQTCGADPAAGKAVE